MSVSPYTTTTTPSGWTCYTCGNWVPNGVTHACTSAVPSYVGPANGIYRLSDADIERIAKRVVELLTANPTGKQLVDAAEYGRLFAEESE